MADPQLNVKIGASVSEALAGLRQVEQAIADVRAPLDEFSRSLREIGEATGITFAVQKIRDWITEAAEAGEHAVNLGAALNLSAEAANNLAGQMSIIGANADTAVRLFGQLSRAIDEAIGQPGSRRGFAFQEAGLDPEHLRDVLSGPNGVINAINELGDAYDRLKARGGDTGVTGPLGVILGTRTFVEIDKMISRGKDFRDALREMWESTAPPSGAGLTALDELAEKIHLVTAAIGNLGKQITIQLSGPLDKFLEWTTNVTAGFTKMLEHTPAAMTFLHPALGLVGAIKDLMGGGEAGATPEEAARLSAIRQRESGGDYSAKNRASTASGAYQIIDETWRRWAGAMGIDTSTYPTARDAPAAMQDLVALHGLRAEGEAPWAASAGRGGAAAGAAAGGTGLTRFDQFTKDKQAYEALQKTIEEGGAREVAEVEQQIALAKQRGATVEEERFLYSDLDAAKRRMYAAEDAAANEFRAKWGAATDEVLAKYKTHDAQKIEADTAFINTSTRLSQQQVQAEVELMNTKIRNLDQTEAEELKQTNRLMQLHQMTAADAQQKELQIVEDHRKAVNEILQQELALAQAIPALRARINAQIQANDLAASKQRKSINDTFEDERLKKAEDINKAVATDFSSTFMSVITGRETLTQAFAQLGEKLGQTLVENIMEKFLQSSIFGAGGFGGLLQGLPLIGGLFGGGAAATDLFTLPVAFGAQGGIVPSAAGGWMVPSFQGGGILARLHSNEMVLPSHISQAVQNMAAGGGGATVNIHAIDTQSGGQFLMRNAGSVGQAALRYSNVSPRAVSSGGARFP